MVIQLNIKVDIKVNMVIQLNIKVDTEKKIMWTCLPLIKVIKLVKCRYNFKIHEL